MDIKKTKSGLVADIGKFFVIIALAFVGALNFQIFVFNNQFAPSGINGIATMVQYLFGISVGYLSLIINIPLCIAAFFIVDRMYAVKSFVYTAAMSLFLILLRAKVIDVNRFEYTSDNSIVLAPIAAGIIAGFSFFCVVKLGGSTGGTDVIGAIVHHYRSETNLVWTIFCLNAVTAFISYFVYDFKIEPVICCLIYIFASSRVSDSVIKSGRQCIKFEIVSPHAEEISERIVNEIKHTATEVDVTGMYSHNQSKMLICIINKWQVAQLRKILQDYPNTFAYETLVNETFGNFKNIKRSSRQS